jgi:hypothetical protein
VLAHHEAIGKPLLQRRTLSIGLAGGLPRVGWLHHQAGGMKITS